MNLKEGLVENPKPGTHESHLEAWWNLSWSRWDKEPVFSHTPTGCRPGMEDSLALPKGKESFLYSNIWEINWGGKTLKQGNSQVTQVGDHFLQSDLSQHHLLGRKAKRGHRSGAVDGVQGLTNPAASLMRQGDPTSPLGDKLKRFPQTPPQFWWFARRAPRIQENSFFTIYCQRRWHHPYGRKQRTEEPLDASEREEGKSWLKTQHSKE